MKKKIWSVSLALVSLLLAMQPTYAKQTAPVAKKKSVAPAKVVTKPAPTAPVTNTTISISKTLHVKLTDVNLLTQDQGDIFSYTLIFNNTGAKEIDLTDYWPKVRSKSGSTFSSSLVTRDRDKKKAPAKSQITLTYFSKVGKGSKIQDLIIDLVKWDLSQANFEKKINSFNLQAGFSTATPSGKVRTVLVEDVPFEGKVTQSFAYSAEKHNMVTISLSLENVGYKNMQDPKIKFSLRSGGGSNFSMQTDLAAENAMFEPKDPKTLTLSAMVPMVAALDQLQLQILQDDISEKKGPTTLAIASFQLPNMNNNNGYVPVYEAKIVKIGNSAISAKVDYASAIQGINGISESINLSLWNEGNSNIQLPAYEFALRTASGYTIPINKDMSNASLKPNEAYRLSLSAEIPDNVSRSALQLFMHAPRTEKSSQYSSPVAVFKLPKVEPKDQSTGTEQYVNVGKHALSVALKNVQRLPWTEGDLVVAQMTMRNSSREIVPLPKINGSFVIDGAKSYGESQVVQGEGSMMLAPNQSVEVYVVTKVPYSLTYREVQIALLEQIGEKNVEFLNVVSREQKPLTDIGLDSKHTLESLGRSVDMKANKALLYPGIGYDIYYTDLEIESLENRQANLSQLVGFFMTNKGQSIRATVIQGEQPLSPKAKTVVSFWAKIPKGTSLTNMKLVLGEGVAEGKLAKPKAETSAFVNAASLQLQTDNGIFKNDMVNIPIYPYNFTLNNISGKLSGSTLTVSFKAVLNKKEQMELSGYEHKAIIEIVDSSGKSEEREIPLDKELKNGNYEDLQISLTNNDLPNIGSAYRVNIYDSFQGHKRKVASQAYHYSKIFSSIGSGF